MMAVLNLRMLKYALRYNIDDINFVHKSEKNITNEFSGHYHPKAT